MRIDPDRKAYARSSEKFSDSNSMLKVLVVGEHAQGSSFLASRLRERGCKCDFATSYEEVCSLVEAQDFYLVLSPTRLRNRDLMPLMDLLEGSSVTLFYAYPVEQGCWWLPALRRGHKCFGECAIRPSEFISVLDQTIEEVRLIGQVQQRKSGTAVA